MKLKFKQNIFVANLGRMVDAREEVEIENKAQAQSFVDSDIAEVITEDKTPSKETPKKVDKVEKKQDKKADKKKGE